MNTKYIAEISILTIFIIYIAYSEYLNEYLFKLKTITLIISELCLIALFIWILYLSKFDTHSLSILFILFVLFKIINYYVMKYYFSNPINNKSENILSDLQSYFNQPNSFDKETVEQEVIKIRVPVKYYDQLNNYSAKKN